MSSTHAQSQYDVTIVIPVYNEEAILRTAVVDLLDRLQAFEQKIEVILAENGSKDATVAVAQGMSERFPNVFTFSSAEPNYGAALRSGIEHARGKIVICDEIDLCDTDFYRRAIGILRTGNAQMVIGSKTMAGSSDERPLIRRLGTRVINAMLKAALDFHGSDTHGLKAFYREPLLPIVEACLVDKDLFASELVIRTERAGLRIVEIPVRVLEKRPPSISLTRRIPNVLKNLGKLVIAIRIRG